MSKVGGYYILHMLEESGGLLTGHFVLSSGLHSGDYLQCAKVLQNPIRAEELGFAMGTMFKDSHIDVVISPAIGGIIIGYVVAKKLETRFIFTEKVHGKMHLRRGFSLAKGERVLIVEDVITTGRSVMEITRIVLEAEAEVVGITSIVDRNGSDMIGYKTGGALDQVSLLKMRLPTYEPSACPLCDKGVPLEVLGSNI